MGSNVDFEEEYRLLVNDTPRYKMQDCHVVIEFVGLAKSLDPLVHIDIQSSACTQTYCKKSVVHSLWLWLLKEIPTLWALRLIPSPKTCSSLPGIMLA